MVSPWVLTPVLIGPLVAPGGTPKVNWPAKDEVWGTTWVVIGAVLVFAVIVGAMDWALYQVLNHMGVFDKLNKVLGQVSGNSSSAPLHISLTTSRVVGWAALIGGVNAILFTALMTLGAFIYNLCSALSGGIEVTLTERRR